MAGTTRCCFQQSPYIPYLLIFSNIPGNSKQEQVVVRSLSHDASKIRGLRNVCVALASDSSLRPNA